MADLSSLSNEDLMALYQKAQDQSKIKPTSSQDLSQLSNEELMELHKQVSSQQLPPAPAKEESFPVVDQINAIGGGVASGLVKGARALGGLATDVLPNSIQDPLRAAGNAVANRLTPSGDSISGKAMAEHPNFALGGDVIGQAAPYAVPGLGATKAGNLALGGLAGAANSNDGAANRALGATAGAGTAGIFNGVASLAQKGLSALRSSSVVKELEDFTANKVAQMNATLKGSPREVGAQAAANVYNTTRQADNELFNAFRNTPGNFDSQMYQTKRMIEDTLDTYRDTLTGPQKEALKEAARQAESSSTIAQLHDVRKTLASNYKHFTPSEGEVVSKAFNRVQNFVDDKMAEVTKEAGVYDEFLNANAHYKTKLLPLIKAGTDDVAKALDPRNVASDPVGAGKVLDNFVDKNIRAGKPQATKAFLDTLDPVGRDAVEVRALERILDKASLSSNPALAVQKEFSKLGKETYDNLFSAENKRIIDGTLRVIKEAEPLLRNSLQKGQLINMPAQAGIAAFKAAAENPPAKLLLKLIGDPSTPRGVVKEFLQMYGSGGVGSAFGTKYNSDK